MIHVSELQDRWHERRATRHYPEVRLEIVPNSFTFLTMTSYRYLLLEKS